MTDYMPVIFIVTVVLSLLLRSYGSRFGGLFIPGCIAALLVSIIPLPARYQFSVFAVVTVLSAIAHFVKIMLNKNSK